MKPLHPLEAQLRQRADPDIAEKAKRFHKAKEKETLTLGIRMPILRALAKENLDLPLTDLPQLLASTFHESRLLALLILVQKYKKADDLGQKQIYDFYLAHTQFINSWDLVDCSAYFIVGPYLENKSRAPLFHLSSSDSLWERRIAMLATLHYIRKKDYEISLRLAKILLRDPEDLIHKVVGWMLKEIANRDKPVADAFLKTHYRDMHRTTLRYCLEKYPQKERRAYLQGMV
ncbi:DNA alkylation repair protein [Kiritimatiellota bacterium B12222]|nr:DNA alkylation repair protein [Kiritimatiellota bacterium B12222]